MIMRLSEKESLAYLKDKGFGIHNQYYCIVENPLFSVKKHFDQDLNYPQPPPEYSEI